MSIAETIAEVSRVYGSNPQFVLAGGGNTSCKDERFLYVKPSGVALATITASDFVKMERSVIAECFTWPTEFASKEDREERIKRLMAYAVATGSDGRPSVEAPLHDLMDFAFVVHLHPTLVNGMTCGQRGREECARLFPDALWVDYVDPGFTLAQTVYAANRDYIQKHNRKPQVIFLQNHGVFVGGKTADEIHATYKHIVSTLEAQYKAANVDPQKSLEVAPLDAAYVNEKAPLLRSWLAESGGLVVVKSLAPFATARGPLNPDQMVYAKAFTLVCDDVTRDAIESFRASRGYLPKVVEVRGKAVFVAAPTLAAAETVEALARDAARIETLVPAFGGVNYLTDAQREFIENWEVESYRQKVAAGNSRGGLVGKVAVVTGGAQGFGYGIAESLVAAGAEVVIADLDAAGAERAAKSLKKTTSVVVNIANEESVAAMIATVVARYGGIDLFVANAGVLKAGSVKTFAQKDWDFVTNVNYIGYFLCVKHASLVMSRQNAASGLWSDIVQVNSKSGLVGSKSNGAYAGSKFGTVGLTQSFALELVADKIKVNSICPGNFYDGPLWSDPENGLFVQYLRTGKVPGAKTTNDVRLHYESQVPMGRGCTPSDVAHAIVYAVTQPYETGQAIPVTGGQVMLH
ncbi:MAG: SDR family NAD(P)-dependent oxidoreductase [Thermoguttaceae bacterium]